MWELVSEGACSCVAQRSWSRSFGKTGKCTRERAFADIALVAKQCV